MRWLPRLITLTCVVLCGSFTHGQRPNLSEQLRIQLADPDDRVYLAKFNSDGTKLLVLSRRSTQIWSTETGKHLVSLEGTVPFERLPEFSWQPGGSKILQYDPYPFSKSDAVIWDGETGKRNATLTEERGIVQAEWNARGEKILTVGNWTDGGIHSRFTFSVRDENGGVIRTGRDLTRQVHSIRFSRTGERLIISYKGKEGLKSIRMYEVNSGTPVRGFDQDVSNVDVFTYAKFAGESPDGRVVCGQIELSKGVTCWHYDDDTRSAYSFLDTKETGDSYLVGFSADSKSVAILRSRQKKIEIADTATGRVRFAVEARNKFTRFGYMTIAGHWKPYGPDYGDIWSPTGRYFVLTDIQKEVTVWDVIDKRIMPRRAAIWDSDYDWFVGTLPTDFEVFSFNPRNELLLSVSARTAKVWNPANGQLVHQVVDAEKRLSSGTFQRYIAQWSPDGKYLLTVADQNRTLVLWLVND